MRTCPLLRNVRHRYLITLITPLRTRFIRISPSFWTIYSSFEINLEWGPSIGLKFKSNALCKFIASKNIQSDINYI